MEKSEEPKAYTNSSRLQTMFKHFTHKKIHKQTAVAEEPDQPVLTEEAEAFLQRIAEEGTPPPLPQRRPPSPQRPLDLPVVGDTEANDAQLTLYQAKDTPLPEAPDTPTIETPIILSEDENEETAKRKERESVPVRPGKKKTKWSFLRRDSRDSKRKSQITASDDLLSAAEGLKSPDAQPNEDGTVSDQEAQKEEQEMANVLDQLNLAAVNNRVFSLSNESQELLRKYAFYAIIEL